MQPIILATADEEYRVQMLERILSHGYSATCCATWPETVAAASLKSTRVLLLDANLPAVSGPFLAELITVLPHSPEARVSRGHLDEVPELGDLKRLLRRFGKIEISRFEQALLPMCGIGPNAVALINELAQNPRPIFIEGERGTGKEWVARIIHRLSNANGAFLLMRPGDEPVLNPEQPGFVYLERLHQHDKKSVRTLLSLARAKGWRVAAGSVLPLTKNRLRREFVQVSLRALRERPKALRPLARLYLDSYQTRLGLPKRRITPRLWKRMEAYHWPSNLRELESFIIQAATSARGPSLSPDHLPRRVLALLDDDQATFEATDAFEAMVEDRLRELVASFQPHPQSPHLHRIVIDSTERALFRLVLQRTAGNQKAAAQLLGLARNTLRTRLGRLEPEHENYA